MGPPKNEPPGGHPAAVTVHSNINGDRDDSPPPGQKQVSVPIKAVRDLTTGLNSAAGWLARELDASIGYAKEDGDYDADDPRQSLWVLVTEREAVQVRDWLRQAATLLAQIGGRS